MREGTGSLLNMVFVYRADYATSGGTVVPGQGGVELEVSVGGLVVASRGFDLAFLPWAQGVATDHERERIATLSAAWAGSNEQTQWTRLPQLSRESISINEKRFEWDRNVELIPEPVLELRRVAHSILFRLTGQLSF
jgi:hypothetical protein